MTIPPPKRAPLAVAIVPSNQAHNQTVDGQNEQEQIAPVAELVRAALSVYDLILPKVFVGAAETETAPGTLPMLRAQVRSATSWLDSQSHDKRTLALHLHSDAGSRSHVGFYHDGDVHGHSYLLGASIAYGALVATFGTFTVMEENYAEESYIAWTEGGHHTVVLLELGSHSNPVDCWTVRERRAKIAARIARQIAEHYQIDYSLRGMERA